MNNTKKPSPRSKARRFAIQLIYQLHTPHIEVGEDLNPHFEQFWEDTGERVSDEVRAFSEELVCGLQEHIENVDQLIQEHAKNWRLDRMALIDLSILRLGAYELLFKVSPQEVAINESVELAKKFSTAEASKFVNGILDAIAKAA